MPDVNLTDEEIAYLYALLQSQISALEAPGGRSTKLVRSNLRCARSILDKLVGVFPVLSLLHR